MSGGGGVPCLIYAFAHKCFIFTLYRKLKFGGWLVVGVTLLYMHLLPSLLYIYVHIITMWFNYSLNDTHICLPLP